MVGRRAGGSWEEASGERDDSEEETQGRKIDGVGEMGVGALQGGKGMRERDQRGSSG